MMDVRFILVKPSHPGNVGAAARAMWVMGFADLVIVDDSGNDVRQDEQAAALASSAVGILQQAQLVSTVEQALDGVNYLCATAMIQRDFGPPTYAPRDFFTHFKQQVSQQQQLQPPKLAILFGTERYGLLNSDVYKCHACLQIPTNPQYGSLNLAAAVQLLAYEARLSLAAFEPPCSAGAVPPADAKKVQAMLECWQQALVQLKFLNPAAPRKLMPRLQQIINRSSLTAKEVNILHGIASFICKKIQG